MLIEENNPEPNNSQFHIKWEALWRINVPHKIQRNPMEVIYRVITNHSEHNGALQTKGKTKGWNNKYLEPQYINSREVYFCLSPNIIVHLQSPILNIGRNSSPHRWKPSSTNLCYLPTTSRPNPQQINIHRSNSMPAPTAPNFRILTCVIYLPNRKRRKYFLGQCQVHWKTPQQI